MSSHSQPSMEVTSYRGAFLVQHPRGVDVVDKETGRWYQAKSLRSAKWNYTVWDRLKRQFQPDVPKEKASVIAGFSTSTKH